MPKAPRRSRWSDPSDTVRFVDSDLPICKLLTAGTVARSPWGYSYLPASYFSVLLDRGAGGIKTRLAKLRSKPHYISLAEQPASNCRELIYTIGRGGAAELRKEGVNATLTSRSVPHELLACLIAASFEIASRQFGIEIKVLPPVQLAFRPDWPLFRFGRRVVFIEADMGNATNEPSEGPFATTSNIAHKFERYLALLTERDFENPFFAFVTCKPDRLKGWNRTLKRGIDQYEYDHDLAEHFGFMSVSYNRFLNSIPAPSSWVATLPFVRPGFAPFCFSPPETNQN
jgi:hypothetical protein